MNSPRLAALAVVGGLMLGAPPAPSAQAPPPARGTIALEGTMKKVYRAVNTIVVTTIDGVDHVYHFTKDLLIHGGKSPADPFEGLREGTTVVVHYTTHDAQQSAEEIDRVGTEGLEETEGVVTRIDRRRKQITIRYDDRNTETLRLTERAAADAGKDVDQRGVGRTRVVVYYSTEAGQKVAHFFRRASDDQKPR